MSEAEEERLFEVTLTAEYVEQSDIEAASAEEAEDRLAFFFQDDVEQGIVSADAFEVTVEATEVDES